MNDRYLACVEHWIDINPLSDTAAARRIADDGIDILIDVNGLTRYARTAVFAKRPAPIQINWLGFPGSMGSPYHHYIIADDWIIPPGSELYYLGNRTASALLPAQRPQTGRSSPSDPCGPISACRKRRSCSAALTATQKFTRFTDRPLVRKS